jgi:hypothetical protein
MRQLFSEEKEMITDDTKKKAVYEFLLRTAHKRLAQAIPGSEETAFAHLSLAAVVNLLFLLRGEWGSLGDYVTTQKALRALVGDDLLWSEPQKSTTAPCVPSTLEDDFKAAPVRCAALNVSRSM